MAPAEWANLYQLYERNGNRCGVRVRRNSWGKTTAIIHSIGGRTEGPLPGEAPYYGNPEGIADVTGNWTEKRAKLSSPGTYAWQFDMN